MSAADLSRASRPLNTDIAGVRGQKTTSSPQAWSARSIIPAFCTTHATKCVRSRWHFDVWGYFLVGGAGPVRAAGVTYPVLMRLNLCGCLYVIVIYCDYIMYVVSHVCSLHQGVHDCHKVVTECRHLCNASQLVGWVSLDTGPCRHVIMITWRHDCPSTTCGWYVDACMF